MTSLLAALADVCRERRQEAGLRVIDIAAAGHLDPATIYQFERARRWPRDPQRMVEAYAAELGIKPGAIWREALERAS